MIGHNICGIPFTNLAFHVDPISRDKLVSSVCCPTWLFPPYNTFDKIVSEKESGKLDIMDFWNSDEMVTFRKSIVDGTYSFCNKETCPSYLSGALKPLPNRARELINKGVYEMDYPPIHILANIDLSCNLSCPSCRKSPDMVSNQKSYARMVSILSSGVTSIYVNGTGELFKNRYLLDALNEISEQAYPNLKKIEIITNGTLLNNTMWSSLSEGFRRVIKSISVSVDAGTEQTYKKIRVGGNFDRLVSNLHFIGKLRKEKKIENFVISMVLQKNNTHELLDFCKLAKQVGVDGVCILKIENWYVQPIEEFSENQELPANWRNTFADRIREAKEFAKSNGMYIYTNL